MIIIILILRGRSANHSKNKNDKKIRERNSTNSAVRWVTSIYSHNKTKTPKPSLYYHYAILWLDLKTFNEVIMCVALT